MARIRSVVHRALMRGRAEVRRAVLRARGLALGADPSRTPRDIRRAAPERAGFDVQVALGLSRRGDSVSSGVFAESEMARNHGVFHDIEQSYLLAYLCRRP